jgi:hypothetical protein
MIRHRLVLPALALAFVSGTAAALTASGVERSASPRRATLELPQAFVEQDDGFVMLGLDLAATFQAGRIEWEIGTGAPGSRVVTVEPVGGRGSVPVGEAPRVARISRFAGSPDQWQTGRRTFGAVRYPELWPGVDLLLEAAGHTLKGTYELAAGVDPELIRLRHQGGDEVFLDASGRLVVRTSAGDLVDDAPVAWQLGALGREAVPVAFVLQPVADGSTDVCFALGDHDPARALFIDPAVIVQCGFFGGIEVDQIVDMDVDAAGAVYITGYTRSTEATFPEQGGPDLIYNGPFSGSFGDVFVAKIDPTGNDVVYAGFLGGSDYDFASGIEVDDLGRAYISGRTGSDENSFPVVGGPDLTYNNGQDGFVARVSADGTQLEYCGYVGGNSEDRAFDIDVDDLYRAYVVGRSESLSQTLPLSGGPALTKPGPNGNPDCFVGRLSPGGGSWEYFGWFGGNGLEDCTGVRADFLGNAWITGWTSSTDLPVSGGLPSTHSGAADTFVAKIAADGSQVMICGYLGGTLSDFPYKPALGPGGSLYVSGYANDAASYPVVVGPQLVPSGVGDGFLTKIAANGQSIVWSGFTPTEWGGAIDVDEDEGLWFVTAVTSGPFGGSDGLVGRVLPDGTGFDFYEPFGGPGDEGYTVLKLLPSTLTPGVREAWVATFTANDETLVPVVSGPDITANGGVDTVLMRLQLADDPWTDLGFAKAGTHGDPALTGTGTMGPLSPLVLTLSNALENTTAWLAVGFSTVYVPFKGGTFIPDITLPGFLVPVPTDGNGEVVLSETTPAGSPPGFSFYAQYWLQDAGAAGAPVSASNGLQGTTP